MYTAAFSLDRCHLRLGHSTRLSDDLKKKGVSVQNPGRGGKHWGLNCFLFLKRYPSMCECAGESVFSICCFSIMCKRLTLPDPFIHLMGLMLLVYPFHHMINIKIHTVFLQEGRCKDLNGLWNPFFIWRTWALPAAGQSNNAIAVLQLQ